MKRVLIAALAACGAWAAYAEDIGVTRADNGDVTVAAGGELTVGPNGLATNNSQNVTVTFEDGGTIKAIPTDKDGKTITAYHRLWRDYFINGTVTYDGSELASGIAPEFRRSVIATNGTLVISADRSAIRFGSADSNRLRNYPLYDISNIVFAAGSGTVLLDGEVTLRDNPGISSTGVAFNPNRARLAIAGQGIVSNRTVWSTKRVNFIDYGSEIVLLDESYMPEGVTPVFQGGKTFRIQPSDIVVTNESADAGNSVARVFWRAKEGSGVVPFPIDLNGGTLELVTTRPAYEFAGKIYRGGTINLQGPYTRTIDEIEGAFTFKNTTSPDGTVVFRQVNPGTTLCNSGRVTFEFEEGALPASAKTVMDAGVQYVVVPAEDGSVNMKGMSFKSSSSRLFVDGDVALSGSALASWPKMGVTNGANVSLALDGLSVPTVVGGNGTFIVGSSAWEDGVGLWLDASQPYDTSTKGAPYYAPPGIAREGYDFGNIFFTNGYPFVEAWYDVRGTERTWRLYNGRYYQGNEFKVFMHVYPYLAQGTFAGRTMSYMTFDVNGAKNSTWSKDGEDSPAVSTGMGANRRLYVDGQPADAKAIIMVFGSQLGGGMAMLGGGTFARAGRTLADPVCKTAPSGTTIWVDGEEVNPTTTYFNGGWQIVSVVGTAAATVSKIGENTAYQDAGGQNYGEILFFTNTLSDVHRRQAEAYLAQKWGVSTYGGAGNAAACPLRAEGRAGAVVVTEGADVELRGTFAGSLTVNGNVTISEALPWAAADVPTNGLVDWYDGDDVASLVLKSASGWTNIVTHQYPRGKTQATSASGFYLWGANNRQPFAVMGARGLGAERTWIDYNHPEGFPTTASDGNVMRFIPWNKSGSNGNAQSQTFRTLLVALDSCKGGGTIVGSGSVGAGSGDFRARDTSSFANPIWSNNCSSNVRTGMTRLNGAAVDQTKGLTGAPEVLSLTAAGNVSALCVDTYYSTETASNGAGATKSQGIIHGEMLMYDSELDADVLANLEAYLMGKWTGVLPDGWSDLREATVTAGTGTVSAVAAKLPAFGDGFTGTVIMPDTSFDFAFDGAAGTVDKPFVARGASLSLPAAVTVNVACANMAGSDGTSVPLLDVAAFANPVTWNLVTTGDGGKTVRLREENGQLLLEVIPSGTTIIFR